MMGQHWSIISLNLKRAISHMKNRRKETKKLSYSLCKMKMLLFMLISALLASLVHGQQSYLANKQLDLDCDSNDTVTNGYLCNGAAPSCQTYLTFLSTQHYNTPSAISLLLGSTAASIASINNISLSDPIPAATLLLVPVTCSCSGPYSQHNVSYTLTPDDTYFVLANDTYQGLTTCQALVRENPYDELNLTGGLVVEVPVRCACPTSKQVDVGIKYLLAYLMDLEDDLDKIAIRFGVDVPTLLEANEFKTSDDVVYPYQPILVPLKIKPSPLQLKFAVPLSPPPPAITPPSSSSSPPTSSPPNKSSNKKRVFIGVGVGGGSLLLLAAVFIFMLSKRRSSQTPIIPVTKSLSESRSPDSLLPSTATASSDEVPSWSSPFSSHGLKSAVESLVTYKYEDLQKSTDFFSEANRIEGSSVFRATFDDGDSVVVAAVKVMTVDSSLSGDEINILKRINHSSVISLTGFCVNNGSTYLVYEFAASGSLLNCLEMKGNISPLSWKQRVQIANDIANALNYLHNFTHPPLIHKNLNTSNILLDANLRAKVANFGLARAVDLGTGEQGFQLTRHVVGTRGYMAPEYMEDGVITPKLDVFAFGVVLLELLSGKPASGDEEHRLLYASINGILEGDEVKEKFTGFMDPCLRDQYPLELAFSMAHLAKSCVAIQINLRPTMAQASTTLSKILSSTFDWESSEAVDPEYSRSLNHGR